MPAICVQAVRKRFGIGGRAVDALRGVDLELGEGEIYGLLGRNGAGKTTLVRILLDIVRADAGRVRVLDRCPADPASRREVGYLPEDHRFPEYRTGAGALGFYAALSGVPLRELRYRVGELMDLVGLGEASRKKIRGYSKGMKQRLGLAQALVHRPRLLLLDEPTDGVDPVGRAEIRQVLERLREEGRTIFLNSHLLSEVEQICDRVGILEQGALVREGPVDALTRSGSCYVVRTDPPMDAETLGELGWVASRVHDLPEGVEVAVQADAEIDQVVDLLRGRGYGIRALHGKRLSLEEVFLEALADREAES